MNTIGRRIFFDVLTGRVIAMSGETRGNFTPTNAEQDIANFKSLTELNSNAFDYIELPFGAYAQDFAECNGYRVNPETKELEFSYPDPNEPEEPPVYEKPLSEQIKELELKTDEAIMELSMVIAMGGMA